MRRLRALPLVLAAVLAPALAWGDQVVLRDGRIVEGKVTRQNDQEVHLEVTRGAHQATVVFKQAEVARIVLAETKRESYADKAAKADPGSYTAQIELADWCRRSSLKKEAAGHYVAAEAIRPKDPYATKSLKEIGYIQSEGEWVSETEHWVARGYARYKGDWLPKELVALLKERDRLVKEIDTKKKRFDNHAEAIAKLEEAIRKADAKLKSAQKEVGHKQGQVSAKTLAMAGAKIAYEVAKTNETRAVLPAQRRTAAQKTKEAKKELDKLERQKANLQRDVAKASRKVKKRKKEKARAEEKHRTALREYENRDEVLNDLEAKLRKVERELKAWERTHPGQVKAKPRPKASGKKSAGKKTGSGDTDRAGKKDEAGEASSDDAGEESGRRTPGQRLREWLRGRRGEKDGGDQ